MIIREASNADIPALIDFHMQVFGDIHGKEVIKLVQDLMKDSNFDAGGTVSLILEDEQHILGHVMYSPMCLDEQPDKKIYILAPNAIIPSRQRQGLGKKLITHGLEKLKEYGVDIVLVYGDPAIYKRLGFTAEHHIKAPYALSFSAEAWLAQELNTGALATTKGEVRCVEALFNPIYW